MISEETAGFFQINEQNLQRKNNHKVFFLKSN